MRSNGQAFHPIHLCVQMDSYINRAGTNLPKTEKRTLERAKEDLRNVFGRGQVERVVLNALARRSPKAFGAVMCAFAESTAIVFGEADPPD
jgi:hypothetical protein